MVKPWQGGSVHYVPTKPIYLSRHASNLILLLPVEERDQSMQDSDANKKNGTDVDASMTIWPAVEFGEINFYLLEELCLQGVLETCQAQGVQEFWRLVESLA